MNLTKIISCILILIFITQPVLAATETGTDYLRGREDARMDARGSPLWILAGLTGTGFCILIGCAGIGVAAIFPPSPPAEKLVGKSSNYILGYTEEYKRKSRIYNAMWATLGCTIAAGINLIVSLIIYGGELPTYY
jgi:cytochrome c553